MFLAFKGRPAMQVALLFVWAVAALAEGQEALAQKSREAKQLMAAGRFADAVPVYEQLLSEFPANPGLRLNLALALRMSGRQRDAIPHFQRVLKAEPSSIPALLSLGAVYLELNQPSGAVPLLDKVVALDPKDVNARGMLSAALLSQGRAREAATHYRKLTSLAPQDPKTWHGLGRSYEALARDAFTRLDKTAQGSPEWLVLIADSRLERGQYRSAFYFYRQALAKKPDQPGVHAALAELYRRTQHPDWAAQEHRKEAALMSRVPCTQHQQACAFSAGRHLEAARGPSLYWQARAYNELALDAFRQLGRLPESVEMHALKAEIFTDHGEYMAAVEEWRAAQKVAPADPAIERELTVALFRAGDYRTALPKLEALLKQEPESPELNTMVGESFLRTEQPQKAVPYLEKALQRDAAMLPARASLGLAYMRVGREREAVPHLAAALEIDDDGSLHYQLGRAYQNAGDAEASRKMLEKYREIQQRSQNEQEALEAASAITAPLP